MNWTSLWIIGTVVAFSEVIAPSSSLEKATLKTKSHAQQRTGINAYRHTHPGSH